VLVHDDFSIYLPAVNELNSEFSVQVYTYGALINTGNVLYYNSGRDFC
jgi:hypothetical protein